MIIGKHNIKLISSLLLSATLLDPLLVLAAVDGATSLDVNNTATVTVSAPLELIRIPANAAPDLTSAFQQNFSFDENVAQLDGREFSDLSDKELDHERAGFFNIFDLAIFSSSLYKSITQTRQTLSRTGAYTAQDFAGQWGATIASMFGSKANGATNNVTSLAGIFSGNAQISGSSNAPQTISDPTGTWTLNRNGALQPVVRQVAIVQAPTPPAPIRNAYLDSFTATYAAQQAAGAAAEAARIKAWNLSRSGGYR